MNTPLVSVIVPVYKAEKYLHKCVDSLLAQTMTDFEVLLIDDGSPDRSGAICDEYAAKDSRIRVFHKENGGVASARQVGIENVRGEYTIHADPDDWVEPTMLEELYAKAKEDDADMVICDYYVNSNKGESYITQKPTNLNHEIVLKEMFQFLHGSTWNKLIRTKCFTDYNLSFDLELSFCEDLFFNTCFLLNSIKVSYLSKAFYHYVTNINPNSIVKSKSIEDFFYNQKLFAKFDLLTKGYSCWEYTIANLAFLVVARAFYGNYFTSQEFKLNCLPYLKFLKRYNFKKKYEKYLLYISCIGGYRLCYHLFFAVRRLK